MTQREHSSRDNNSSTIFPLEIVALSIIILILATTTLLTTLAYGAQEDIARIFVEAEDTTVGRLAAGEQPETQEATEEEVEEAEEQEQEQEQPTTVTTPTEQPTITTETGGGGGGGPQTYQDVNRAEVIANDGTVQNPGGADNENILVPGEVETGTVGRPMTNLQDNVLPQSVPMQEYEDFKIALMAAGYGISDMQYTLAYKTSIPMIVVRGAEGMATQPNLMLIEQVAATYGYSVISHLYIGNAWETVFVSATGY